MALQQFLQLARFDRAALHDIQSFAPIAFLKKIFTPMPKSGLSQPETKKRSIHSPMRSPFTGRMKVALFHMDWRLR